MHYLTRGENPEKQPLVVQPNDELGTSESASKNLFKLLLKNAISDVDNPRPPSLHQQFTNWGSGIPELWPLCAKALEHIHTRLDRHRPVEMHVYLRRVEGYTDVERDIAARAFRIKLMEECYGLSDSW